MSLHLPHSDYYRDRSSEDELCRDFPGDNILIDGLKAMQMHFWNNGLNINIPVLRVMNTAHYIAAYMFVTTCSGDQAEYDVLAYDSLGRDKLMMRVAIIVLAAMLRRTDGFRAKQCRNVLLDNRDPDFDEGVTLYDQFLRSAERRFAEEDFLIDIPTLVQRNQELEYEVQQLKTENIKLKYIMENQQNNQYNNCVIYNAPVYNTSTTNNYYPQPEDSPLSSAPDVKPEEAFFCRITQEAYDKGKARFVENDLRSACVSAPKLVKAIRTNEAMSYLDTQNLPSTELFRLLKDHFEIGFDIRAFQLARSK